MNIKKLDKSLRDYAKHRMETDQFSRTHLDMYKDGRSCPFCGHRDIQHTKNNEVRWCSNCTAVGRQSCKMVSNSWVWASLYEIKNED